MDIKKKKVDRSIDILHQSIYNLTSEKVAKL